MSVGPSEDRFFLPPFSMRFVLQPMSEVHDWSHEFLGIKEAWKQNQGEGVKVLVADTGVDMDHPDLEIADAVDFTGSSIGPRDRLDHGTWCCGFIAAKANAFGVRGIAPHCKLYSAKVLGDDGSGTERSIASGIQYAMRIGADFVSMSLGGYSMSNWMRGVIREYVSGKGRFIFAAAGNDGHPNTVNYPAKWPETIAVAAVDKNGRRARFSSMGEEVDIASPGVNMISTVTGGRYAKMSGTSMATPCACGVGILSRSEHLKQQKGAELETYGQMRQLLKDTALDVGPDGYDSQYGFGLIQPGAMLPRQEDGEPAPEPDPEDQREYDIGFAKIHIPARQGDQIGLKL